MSEPTTTRIERYGHGTGAAGSGGPAAWTDVEQLLRRGSGTTWLSVPSPRGVHTRPVFAAWTGTDFVTASKAGTAKTGHLEADGRVTLGVDLGTLHLVVEGRANRLRSSGLERAATAFEEVFGWPTTPVGDELDAPYGAPTSGGPPYRAYEIAPERAFAFPTADEVEPTRFTWPVGGA